MASVITPRKFGERLGLKHIEVIRRIRRGDIRAQKLDGWAWIIDVSEVERVQSSEWYKRVQKKRAREQQVEPAT